MGQIFVDRVKEIEELVNCINEKIDVFIYGLRGIEKTSLLEKIAEILSKRGKRVIFIDGYEILSTEDIYVKIGERGPLDSREALQALLDKVKSILIIDEFSAFVEALANYKPFKKVEDFLKFFRSRMRVRKRVGGESIILSSSALGFVKKIAMKYFSPLFREFKLMYLGPMPLEAVYEFAKLSGLEENKALEIAELSGGNPYYAKKIVERVLVSGESPREALFSLISPRGDLDIYFSAMVEKLAPEERMILHLVARGLNRFYEIEERLFKDPTLFLKRLEENGFLAKVKKGKKHSEYVLVDKILQAWLQDQEIPTLGKMSKEAITVSSLGFEALVREVLRTLTRKVEIKDILGQSLEIPPFKAVYNHKGSDYEIDSLAIDFENQIYAFEIHFWGEATYKKILQLEKNAKKYEKEFGKKIAEKIVISYFGYKLKQEEKRKILEKKIKLLTAKELRKIQKATGTELAL